MIRGSPLLKTSPSTIEQAGTSGDKIPTSSTIFFEGSNSLKLRWTSKSGGDWQAYIIAPWFSIPGYYHYRQYIDDGMGTGWSPKIGHAKNIYEAAPEQVKQKV